MKATIIPVLLVAFVGVFSCAGQIQFAPDLGDDHSVTADPRTPVPLTPPPSATMDFATRLKAAVEQHDLAGIEALYQTNGVTSAEMKRELSRWQSLLTHITGTNVSVWFKDIGALQPVAHRVWGDNARRLTTHKVTHLAALSTGTAATLVFPLVEVDGKLWIVPSDKARPGSCNKPSGATSGSQQTR